MLIRSAVLPVIAMTAAAFGQQANDAVTNPKPPRPRFETYRQEVTVVLRNARTAEAAGLTVLPLYDGKEWAITSRWDDNTPPSAKMRLVMDKHGYRGTYYLNGSDHGYWGKRYGLLKSPKELDRFLVASGTSAIGGHGWEHAFLGWCHRNRIFEEIARVRADREADADVPICSYAFAYLGWSNHLEREAVALEIAEVLFRSGFYHVANANYLRFTGLEIPAANLLPWDGAEIDAAFTRLLADEKVKQTNPNICFSMHAYEYDTDAKWAKLEAQLAKYGRREEWWYCTQNEYAAYRLQRLHTKVETRREGNRLIATLTRPHVLDLNDSTPLTFEITGTDAAGVLSATADKGRAVEASTREAYRFHLHHPPGHRLPEKIGWIHSDDAEGGPQGMGADDDFPDIRGRFWRKAERFGVTIHNGARTPLENVRIVWRLPLAWKGGSTVTHHETITPGKIIEATIRPERAGKDYKYTYGPMFFAAQVDFVHRGKPARLHLTLNDREPGDDASYPAHRFKRIGPIPLEQFSKEKAVPLARGKSDSVTLEDGSVLSWRAPDQEKTAIFDVELAWARRWRMSRGYHVLLGRLISPVAQRVRLATARRPQTAVYVNGEEVRPGEAASLRKGDNRLVLVTVIGKGKGLRPTGVFLRVLSPRGRKRVSNVRFELPVEGS